MPDVDVELARSAQLVARARRQDTIVRLVRAKRQLGGVYVAAFGLAVAVAGFGAAAFTAGMSVLLWIAVICAVALVHNLRKAGPQARATVGIWQQRYDQVHADWEAALQRLLEAEARHEETP